MKKKPKKTAKPSYGEIELELWLTVRELESFEKAKKAFEIGIKIHKQKIASLEKVMRRYRNTLKDLSK